MYKGFFKSNSLWRRRGGKTKSLPHLERYFQVAVPYMPTSWLVLLHSPRSLGLHWIHTEYVHLFYTLKSENKRKQTWTLEQEENGVSFLKTAWECMREIQSLRIPSIWITNQGLCSVQSITWIQAVVFYLMSIKQNIGCLLHTSFIILPSLFNSESAAQELSTISFSCYSSSSGVSKLWT